MQQTTLTNISGYRSYSLSLLWPALLLLLSLDAYADNIDRQWKDSNLWDRHQKNSGKYFDRQDNQKSQDKIYIEKNSREKHRDYPVNRKDGQFDSQGDHQRPARDHSNYPSYRNHDRDIYQTRYKVYSRNKYEYYRNPWYNTFYLAPVHIHYHPYGHRVRYLPHSHVRIVINSLPYYYYSGMYYTSSGSSYVVVRAPIGAFVETLPAGFIAFSLGLSTYYFVNDTYYSWDEGRQGYYVVNKPSGADEAVKNETSERLFAYPNSGQSEEQQSRDRYECHQWAVSETKSDPSTTGTPLTEQAADNYRRAISACLEAKNYTVK